MDIKESGWIVLCDCNIKRPFIIGIAGGSGSGKTTLAKALQLKIGLDKSILFQTDSYYRDLGQMPIEKRNSVNFDHPDAMDLELFASHLLHLRKSKPVKKPVYDFNTHTRLNFVEYIKPKDVVITEGILLFTNKRISECIDFGIFMDIDADTRFKRRMKRDVDERGRTPESVRKQYYSSVEPMYNKFVEPSRRYADLILKDASLSNWINTFRIEF